MSEKFKDIILFGLLGAILIFQFLNYQNQPKYKFMETGETGLVWKINESTGDLSVCKFGDYIMREAPECSPSSNGEMQTSDSE